VRDTSRKELGRMGRGQRVRTEQLVLVSLDLVDLLEIVVERAVQGEEGWDQGGPPGGDVEDGC
jgi:hypothetical protein